MIEYDVVLEDLPERVRELAVRLRDMMLSLGPNIVEGVGRGRLEYSLRQPFGFLAPDRTGVSLGFVGPFDPPIRDPEGRVESAGKHIVLRLASAANIDDYMRRIAREAFAVAQQRSSKERKGPVLDDTTVDLQLEEALKQVSRGLRLMSHHLQVMQKTAEQKAASAARLQGQKRSHKKKSPVVPPPLLLASPPVMAEAPKKPVKKSAPKKEPVAKKPSKPAPKKKATKKKPARKR